MSPTHGSGRPSVACSHSVVRTHLLVVGGWWSVGRSPAGRSGGQWALGPHVCAPSSHATESDFPRCC
jgi:hypothetical protein